MQGLLEVLPLCFFQNLFSSFILFILIGWIVPINVEFMFISSFVTVVRESYFAKILTRKIGYGSVDVLCLNKWIILQFHRG